jgi:hypothetical protein
LILLCCFITDTVGLAGLVISVGIVVRSTVGWLFVVVVIAVATSVVSTFVAYSLLLNPVLLFYWVGCGV